MKISLFILGLVAVNATNLRLNKSRRLNHESDALKEAAVELLMELEAENHVQAEAQPLKAKPVTAEANPLKAKPVTAESKVHADVKKIKALLHELREEANEEADEEADEEAKEDMSENVSLDSLLNKMGVSKVDVSEAFYEAMEPDEEDVDEADNFLVYTGDDKCAAGDFGCKRRRCKERFCKDLSWFKQLECNARCNVKALVVKGAAVEGLSESEEAMFDEALTEAVEKACAGGFCKRYEACQQFKECEYGDEGLACRLNCRRESR